MILPSKFNIESLNILILSICSKVKRIPEFGKTRNVYQRFKAFIGWYYYYKTTHINYVFHLPCLINILLKADAWHLLLLSSCCATSSPRHSPHNYYLLFIPFFFYKKYIQIDSCLYIFIFVSFNIYIYFFFISNFLIIFFTFTYFLNIYIFFNLSSSLTFSSPHYPLV